MSVSGRRYIFLLASLVLFAGLVGPVFFVNQAFANQITGRSLTLSSSSPADQTSTPTTVYTFTFTVPQATIVQSVSVQICLEPTGTCTTPPGFSNTTGPSTLDSQPTGLGDATGWTVDNATTGSLRIKNATNATAPSGPQTVVFGHVQNPTTANQTFFGRITTYSDAGWTAAIDSGTVAASTATQIQLSGTMPESLIFCTGQTVSVNGGGIPDCSTATGGNISFNRLFSPTQTAYASSQMSASTNALFGYSITVAGPTLTSGGNTIPAIGGTAATSASTVGSSKFGLNIVHDTETYTLTGAEILNPLSANVNPTPDGVYLMGKAAANFDTDGSYAFDATTPNIIAKSDNGTGTSAPTDPQIYTTTYMVNVAGHQVAGTYTTTLTYICTPTF